MYKLKQMSCLGRPSYNIHLNTQTITYINNISESVNENEEAIHKLHEHDDDDVYWH